MLQSGLNIEQSLTRLKTDAPEPQATLSPATGQPAPETGRLNQPVQGGFVRNICQPE
ncbi:hypothetical protein [Mixta hanseatica]|uniref:Uncharacterized protein n=1 Tax=Mixta hanseatica TaxID=2872648 RepID=A0ABY4R3Z9_9GAMM|nr:hypothetical protein [Mixta hanseatica]UQY42838.1 hypothetical protein K6958_13030 [Mixta hanseatica]